MPCYGALPDMDSCPENIFADDRRIINVASGAGNVSSPYMSAYVTSKAAVIRFKEVLAMKSAGMVFLCF